MCKIDISENSEAIASQETMFFLMRPEYSAINDQMGWLYHFLLYDVRNLHIKSTLGNSSTTGTPVVEFSAGAYAAFSPTSRSSLDTTSGFESP